MSDPHLSRDEAEELQRLQAAAASSSLSEAGLERMGELIDKKHRIQAHIAHSRTKTKGRKS